MPCEIDQLLAGLTAAFERVSHRKFGVCARCFSEADEAALNGRLADVPDELVVTVAAEVFDHWPELRTCTGG